MMPRLPKEVSVVPNFSRFSQVAVIFGLGLCVALAAEPPTRASRSAQEIADLVRDANGGNRDAQRELGFLYLNGQGVPQDFENAAYRFRQAANNGDAVAENNLGLMYLNGQGVSPGFRR